MYRTYYSFNIVDLKKKYPCSYLMIDRIIKTYREDGMVWQEGDIIFLPFDLEKVMLRMQRDLPDYLL